MRLIRLEVRNFSGIAACGVDFEGGFNVLYGPNELGKSSLVQAIRAALLIRPGTVAARGLPDWHTDAEAEVTLTFEQEAQRIWRVRKTFTENGGSAYLEFSRDGVDFSQEGRGREVEEQLQTVLRWGLQPPGGRGRSGAPASFIATALLGSQADVVSIFTSSLADDTSDSGRELLTDALQAMAEDPLFKAILASVQEHVDEAYTATGRRRGGRASPWTEINERRRDAEVRSRDAQARLDESQAAQLRIGELHDQLLTAENMLAERQTALDQMQAQLSARADFDAARHKRDAAAAELMRIQGLVDACERKTETLQAARKEAAAADARVSELAAERAELAPLIEATRSRVRELESGAAEQQRRLREQALENQQLELDAQAGVFAGQLAQGKRIGELRERCDELQSDIETLEARLAEEGEMLELARRKSEDDDDALAELELDLLCVRYIAASRSVEAATRRLTQVKADRDAAHTLAERADTLTAELGRVELPDDTTLAALRELATDVRIAQDRLAVGLVVSLTLESDTQVDVSVDGNQRDVRAPAGQRTAIEAEREFSLEVPGFGSVSVSGGSAEHVRAAEEARTRWQQTSKPVFARAQCAALDELETLVTTRRTLQDELTGVQRQQAELRGRLDGADELERQAVTARAAEATARQAVEAMLDDGESLAELVALRKLPADEAEANELIGALHAQVNERRDLVEQLEQRHAGGRARLDSLRVQATQAGADLDRETAALGDGWQLALERAAAGQAGIAGRRDAIVQELAALRESASDEVDEARSALDSLAARDAALGETVATAEAGARQARDGLTRLEGELEAMRTAVAAEDLDGALAVLDAATVAVAALPEPPALDGAADEHDLQAAREALEAARSQVALVRSQLDQAEGALTQVGGQAAEEQAQQARDALAAIGEREHALEVEFGGWKLLKETLTEAEQEEGTHLGNALVGPVSERMRALTGNRYGEMQLGPHLDADGIRLGNGLRAFENLSVGTQEQLALLLRLAIAEALGSFIVLDDHLTQTDRGRMEWLRELLGRASGNIQVVVMTCHPDDYLSDTSDTHSVDLASRLTRTDVSGVAGPVTLAEASDTTADTTSDNAVVGAATPTVDPAPVQEPRTRRGRRKREAPADEGPDLLDALRATLDQDKKA